MNIIQLTAKIKLMPNHKQQLLLRNTCDEFIAAGNALLGYLDSQVVHLSLTSRSFRAELPSAVKNEVIRYTKSAYTKFLKTRRFPVFKKPIAVWNNQNFKVKETSVEFPVLLNGKSSRISVAAVIPGDVFALLQRSKLGTLRITRKSDKWIAQIAYAVEPVEESAAVGVMGVDLGIKCPAVVATSDGKVSFFGNGRQRKQVRRHHYSRRKKLGEAKKLRAIRKSRDKEQRWMKDQDHQLSRALVNYAVAHSIGTIKLEELQHIRKRTTSKSRKNNRAINSWSFYRLARFIEYKAHLAGIAVVYVNPAFTSQICPRCGSLNHANDRTYSCNCGYHSHRDLVGARNILAA